MSDQEVIRFTLSLGLGVNQKEMNEALKSFKSDKKIKSWYRKGYNTLFYTI